MKCEIGTITIKVECEAYTEADGDVFVNGGSPPELSVEIDLPGNNPVALAIKYLRKIADELEQGPIQ